MLLKYLHLANFKNYTEIKLDLSPEINVFTGKNGSGKTNLLDAIYYLSFTRSFFNQNDVQLIRHQQEWMFVEGRYDKNNLEETVKLSLQKGETKILKANNNEVGKFSDHIGNYPLVMIVPNDINLIYEGSEERRKFLNGMISQLDKLYLNDLLSYNRVLDQRNRQLKVFAQSRSFDRVLLDSFNEQLIRLGKGIHSKRKEFLESFIPMFTAYYRQFSGSGDEVNIIYDSALNTHELRFLLEQSEENDLFAQRTTMGIHKDDLAFRIGDFPLKKFGSQGQQKSFIISLKLSQHAYLKEKTGINPLFLLDDLFEKLDGERLSMLMNLISDAHFGQIFITDTHLERMQNAFVEMKNRDVRYFSVEEGKVIPG